MLTISFTRVRATGARYDLASVCSSVLRFAPVSGIARLRTLDSHPNPGPQTGFGQNHALCQRVDFATFWRLPSLKR